MSNLIVKTFPLAALLVSIIACKWPIPYSGLFMPKQVLGERMRPRAGFPNNKKMKDSMIPGLTFLQQEVKLFE